jgi:hypothetical protein
VQDPYLPPSGCSVQAARVGRLTQPTAASHEIAIGELHIREDPQQVRVTSVRIERFVDNLAGRLGIPIFQQFLGAPHRGPHRIAI